MSRVQFGILVVALIVAILVASSFLPPYVPPSYTIRPDPSEAIETEFRLVDVQMTGTFTTKAESEAEAHLREHWLPSHPGYERVSEVMVMKPNHFLFIMRKKP